MNTEILKNKLTKQVKIFIEKNCVGLNKIDESLESRIKRILPAFIDRLVDSSEEIAKVISDRLEHPHVFIAYLAEERNGAGRHLGETGRSMAIDFLLDKDGKPISAEDALGNILHLIAHGVGKGSVETNNYQALIKSSKVQDNVRLTGDSRILNQEDCFPMIVEYLSKGILNGSDVSRRLSESIVAELGPNNGRDSYTESQLSEVTSFAQLVMDGMPVKEMQQRMQEHPLFYLVFIKRGVPLNKVHEKILEEYYLAMLTNSEKLAELLRGLRRNTKNLEDPWQKELLNIVAKYSVEESVGALIDINMPQFLEFFIDHVKKNGTDEDKLKLKEIFSEGYELRDYGGKSLIQHAQEEDESMQKTVADLMKQYSSISMTDRPSTPHTNRFLAGALAAVAELCNPTLKSQCGSLSTRVTGSTLITDKFKGPLSLESRIKNPVGCKLAQRELTLTQLTK